jgi:hypothetical protein
MNLLFMWEHMLRGAKIHSERSPEIAPHQLGILHNQTLFVWYISKNSLAIVDPQFNDTFEYMKTIMSYVTLLCKRANTTVILRLSHLFLQYIIKKTHHNTVQ